MILLKLASTMFIVWFFFGAGLGAILDPYISERPRSQFDLYFGSVMLIIGLSLLAFVWV